MYVLIAGGGKAGANVMRTLLRNGHEATIIEQRRDRYERVIRGAARLRKPDGSGREKPPEPREIPAKTRLRRRATLAHALMSRTGWAER